MFTALGVPRSFLLFIFPMFLMACGGGSGGPSSHSLSITLGSSIVLAPQDGTPAQTSVVVSGAMSSISLSLSNVPSGVASQLGQPDATGRATMTLIASPAIAPGTYSLSISASSGSDSAAQSFTLVVAVAAVVSNSIDTTLGINGKLRQFMSTSFQPAEWDYQFFQLHPTVEPAQLNQLAPQHIRIQAISQAIPWKANSNPQVPTDWDFSMLDAVVQPVLSVTDNSPEFQIAVAPNLPGLLDSSGHFLVTAPNLQIFASYAANLVRYYNTGGFLWGGQLFKSASSHRIIFWGIFNEYNINGLTPAEYVQLYNTVVPAMLAVDPTIKFSALELSDYDYQNGDPRNNLPTFVAAADAGGVNAQVDVASTHFYATCDQQTPDTQVFSAIPTFVSDIQYFRQQLASRPDLANVPVWVTENNVNADYADSNGNSTCNPGQKFVADQRGTGPFFAAWRPYLFSQFAKAGNQALYHWDYAADSQYSEVDYNTANKYLSYWVDGSLGYLFPVTSSASPDILALTATESSTVESLATRNPDGSFVIMITAHAVHAPADNNGSGDSRTVIVDVSALGNYSSVSQILLQSGTDLTNGPQPAPLTISSKLSVTLNGYGTAFLHLQP